MVLFEKDECLVVDGGRTVGGVDYVRVNVTGRSNAVELTRMEALELAEALIRWAKGGVG